MSANSSNSLHELLVFCRNSPVGTSITAYTITNAVLLLPLCIYIIHLGLQQWRRQRSGAMTSHSDLFTYHMVVVELMNVVGSVLSSFGVLIDVPEVSILAVYILDIGLIGQQYFHILTCMDRYLAVVHPVTYLSLRGERGIRIRNISIACVWLLSISSLGFLTIKNYNTSFLISFCFTVFILTVISFCCLSVLCVLIHPGPGEGGGGRKRVDQSKLRAFYTIMAILGALLLRLGGGIICTGVSVKLTPTGMCIMWLLSMWFCLPSSLVQPLLFLHRAGKLPGCRSNTESGQGSD